MTQSNYPPGVTGREPELSGSVPADPHEPFTVWGDHVSVPDREWIVTFGSEEDPVFGLTFKTEAEAEAYADALNESWPDRDCQWQGKDGWSICSLCGDVRGDLPD